MSNSVPKYRPDIDGLRAVAVLAVVIFHAFPSNLPGGFIGVDVFFVISGFLISRIILTALNENKFSIGDFYSRRIKRIFPALTLTLATCGVIGWLVLYQDEMRQLGRHIAAGAGFISNLVLWKEAGYFDSQSELKPLLHLWSLGIEEQFYMLWPLLLYWVHRKRSNPVYIIAVVTTLSFVANIFFFRDKAVATFYFPFTRFWELGIGGLLAHLLVTDLPFKASKRLLDVLSVSGFVFIGSGIAILNKDSQFPGWWATLPVLGSLFIIMAGPGALVNRWMLSNKLLVWVGLISYPLYLWHWPILAYARIILGGNLVKSVALISILLSFVLAWATYYFLERNLRHRSGTSVVVSLSSFMIVIAILGVLSSNGYLRKNMSSLTLQLARTYDTGPAYRYHKCFLDSDTQKANDFSDECLTLKNNGKKNLLLLLWGDSHAAHLFPGIKNLQGNLDFNLVQRTATSCPPLIGGEAQGNGSCLDINRSTMDYIVQKKPDIVVLGSRWSRDNVDLESKIAKTTEFLRSSGVKEIVIFGPPPQWLPQLKYLLLRKNLTDMAVPKSLNPKEQDFLKITAMDQRLRDVSKKLNIRYVSIVDSFCEKDDCVVRVGDHYPDDLISSDSDHFTENASVYLLSRPEVKNQISSAIGG